VVETDNETATGISAICIQLLTEIPRLCRIAQKLRSMDRKSDALTVLEIAFAEANLDIHSLVG